MIAVAKQGDASAAAVVMQRSRKDSMSIVPIEAPTIRLVSIKSHRGPQEGSAMVVR